MAKTYRSIQQWDHWLQQTLGQNLLQIEKERLVSLLEKIYGKHALLIGSPQQEILLDATMMPHHVLITPMIKRNLRVNLVDSEFYELPIASGSVDLVLLPHTLEHVDNPAHALREACRIVKPEGHLLVFGFNPMSLWGLKKYWTKNQKSPWSNNFISPNTIKKWLALSDFRMIKQDSLLFKLPAHRAFNLSYLERVGRKMHLPFGGIYMIMAQTKSIPLTPIRMRWKQKLAGFPVGIPKPTIRNVS